MKLSDFSLLDNNHTTKAIYDKLNQTKSNYPEHKTINAIFSEQAKKTPDAIAVIDDEKTLTYCQLDEASNQVAHFLEDKGLQAEDLVAVMIKHASDLLITLLGILKAGGAYLPLEDDVPLLRRQYIIDNANACFLFFEKERIREVNKLQWQCQKLSHIFCINSDKIHAEIEQNGALMNADVWDYVGKEAFNDISGGGWKNSYTGEWLSRSIMDNYSDNIYTKLLPYLNAQASVLEVGCSSGISMFRLAPKVGFYCGTDLSADILAWTTERLKKSGLNNIQLYHLAAHDTHQIKENKFQIAIINSVIQCFSGHNYFRNVLEKMIALMDDKGVIFLGNILDQEKKNDLVQSLKNFTQQSHDKSFHTKIDKEDDLFIAKAFFEDLCTQLSSIVSIEYSSMLGNAHSELSEYGYDVILHIDKTKHPKDTQPLNKYQFDRKILATYDKKLSLNRAQARNLAYVMYTSGTTGQSKGVLVEHRAVIRLVINTNYINLTCNDRILQTSSLAFDASTFEIWGALLNGASFYRPEKYTILNPSQLKERVSQYKISTLFLTTSLFNQLVDEALSLFGQLKNLYTGGEVLSTRHVNKVVNAYPAIHFCNLYGPTENTTFSSFYPILGVFHAEIPIGKPISNTEILILDDKGALVPSGVVGEICIAGDGLARGYLDDPKLTEEKFRAHPFKAGQRLYYTGDLGRLTTDGNIEFTGRRDDQVKLRGFRVELNEIKSFLLQYEAIKDANIVLTGNRAGNKELVAYLCFWKALSIETLRQEMRQHLPEYMIPAHFISIEKMPLTITGKLDKSALPLPKIISLTHTNDCPPKTEIEKKLAKIWESILNIKGVGQNDNFFDIGGHSLKVTQLIAKIHEEMGTQLPLATIFKSTSLKTLADAIMAASSFGLKEVDNILVQLNNAAHDDAPNIFAFPPGTGDAIGYLQLAQALSNYHFYAFNFIIEETRIADYVTYLLDIQKDKPFVLLGYSAGGNLAYHVAEALAQKKQTVSDIIMIDSAQVCQPIRYPESEIRHTIEQFLSHDSIKPYLHNYVLKEKAEKIINTYYEYLSQSIDQHKVQANIHLLQAEGEKECYWSTDKDIRLLLSDEVRKNPKKSLVINSLGWKKLTQKQFYFYQGKGTHNDLLYHPQLKANATILQQILENIFNQ